MRSVVNEEAGFLQALSADPDDRTVLLVYADWLDERNDPRGEYLRLLTAENPDRARLGYLRHTLDVGWVRIIATRSYRSGERVKIIGGPFGGMPGRIVAVSDDRLNASVHVVLFGRDASVDVDLAYLELVDRTAGAG